MMVALKACNFGNSVQTEINQSHHSTLPFKPWMESTIVNYRSYNFSHIESIDTYKRRIFWLVIMHKSTYFL